MGALNAYRGRLQAIAQKPDKARFLRPWMTRVDHLGKYLGMGDGGQGSDNVIDDPSFALDPEPLDPVEAAHRTRRKVSAAWPSSSRMFCAPSSIACQFSEPTGPMRRSGLA
ncbi:MAG: hypothetical protein ABW205_09710 [Burkholderiales bacterium]